MVGCASDGTAAAGSKTATVAPWPDLQLPVITGAGYGQDPNLIAATVPWPLTLTPPQLDLLALLCDIIIPAEGKAPSAAAVAVPEVIDEWLSAPYPLQQQHREQVLAGLLWTDRQALARYNNIFAVLTAPQQIEIIDQIAYPNASDSQLIQPVAFFDTLRYLTVGFFVTTAAGTEDLGYLGNTPIVGDYPGPSTEALTHLDGVLATLGLSLP